MIDRFEPWYAQLLGTLLCLVSMLIALFTAQLHISAICISLIIFDCGPILAQTACAYRLVGLNDQARSRLNSCLLVVGYTGQMTGTAVMSRLYGAYGWKPSGGFAVGVLGLGVVVLLVRGPGEQRWVGWRGGRRVRKGEVVSTPSNVVDEGEKGKNSSDS